VIKSCIDKKQANRLEIHRNMWPDKGRSVPGLKKNIFFWDLAGNAESRPVAGLSACNQAEAEAVASLTKWLLLCGCPPASISIITPYKGQKSAITLALRKNKSLPPFRHDQPLPARNTTITVSTVDRYQGDENDIVILSLVRCSPGNRFVGLQNRFVVAVSRARLGLYVIGSVKAVTMANRSSVTTDGPAHWRRFIDDLTGSERCSSTLPICCPRHQDIITEKEHQKVIKVTQFPSKDSWKSFCSLPCRAVLKRCGHLCKLACHCPVDTTHNGQCREILPRPCETHAQVLLLCHDVEIKEGLETLAQALERFECNIKVEYSRPECDHVIRIACYYREQVLKKLKELSPCEEIVSDYIHPVCNHRFSKPKCAVKRKYETQPPKCAEKVEHKRPCGCISIMQCHERNEELEKPSICQSSKNIARPRCGHELSLRCYQAQNLMEDWNEQSGKSATEGKI
jgi:hypothetical protein